MKNGLVGCVTSFRCTLVASFVFVATVAVADHDIYTMPWDGRGEILQYHTCGCADLCWVAEVLNTRTRRRVARLRCDCEKASIQVGVSAEKPFAATCTAFENDDKTDVVKASLEHALHRPYGKLPRHPETSR